MEDADESRVHVILGPLRKCLKVRLVLALFGLLLCGINSIFLGAYFYNKSLRIEYAVLLAAGVLISSFAFGVLLTKLLKRLRMWYITQTPDFEEFSNETGGLDVIENRSPELELNEPVLPSGVLRLSLT